MLSASETLPQLVGVIDIENAPVQYGGGSRYEPGMLPRLDDETMTQLQWIGESRDAAIGAT